MELFLIWMLFGIICAIVANNKGRDGCGWFLLGALLGPFGLILALVVSTNKTKLARVPAEVERLINEAGAKYNSGNYDGALELYQKVLALHPSAPNTHFMIASIHSIRNLSSESFWHLAKAVELGYSDFKRVSTDKSLENLRTHPDFAGFVQRGYVLKPQAGPQPDRIGSLEKLAELRDRGILTETEFQEEKRKLLS